MEKKVIKIYCLYSIDKHGRTKFHGRHASRHRLSAAALALGLDNWKYEIDYKEDEYGDTVIISQELAKQR
jgi:hypothetical protein